MISSINCLHRCALLLLGAMALSSSPSFAGPQLWKYPCDVFMRTACFRLPGEMSVTYEVRVDFGLYVVNEDSHHVASIYVGNSPNIEKFSRPPAFSLDSSEHVLDAFLSRYDEENQLDILITPKSRNLMLVHIYTPMTSYRKAEIASVLSSLRPCSEKPMGDFSCSSSSEWGRALADWILTLTEDSFGR